MTDHPHTPPAEPPAPADDNMARLNLEAGTTTTLCIGLTDDQATRLRAAREHVAAAAILDDATPPTGPCPHDAEHGPCDGDPIECTADAIRGQAEEETRRERDLLRAALIRIVALAQDMRDWCSPHGVVRDYSDRLAETILGAPYPYRAGEAIAALDGDLAAALQAVDDQWRQVAGDASDRLVRAYQLLAEILCRFEHHGHPGYSALRTGWIQAERVDQWRTAHRELLPSPATSKETPDRD